VWERKCRGKGLYGKKIGNGKKNLEEKLGRDVGVMKKKTGVFIWTTLTKKASHKKKSVES